MGQRMGEIMGGKAAVANEDDLSPGQPADQLQCRLPGPVGQGFMPLAVATVCPLGWCQQRQHRQGLDQAGPRHRGQHHEAEPAQPADLDEMAVAGADEVAVDPSRRDLRAPSAFDGVVQTNDNGTIAHQLRDHQFEQSPGYSTQTPEGVAEDILCYLSSDFRMTSPFRQ